MIVFPKQHWLISVFFSLVFSSQTQPCLCSQISSTSTSPTQPSKSSPNTYGLIYLHLCLSLTTILIISVLTIATFRELCLLYIFFGTDLLFGWFEHDSFHSVNALMPCGDEIDVYKHKACLFFICRLLGLWCFSCVLWTNRIGGSGMDIRSKARVSRYSVYPSSVFLLCFLYGWSVFVLVYTDTPRTSDRSIKASQVELRRVQHRSGRWRWQWSHSIVCSSIMSIYSKLYEIKTYLILILFCFVYSPQAIFRDPFRRGNNILVMCDAYTPAGNPIPTNKRHNAAKIFSNSKVASEEPWY